MKIRLWLLLLFLVSCGCGSSEPFKYVKVTGKVTYDDGTPIPGGAQLTFISQDVAPVGTMHPRPAVASVNENGEFDTVTSHKYGDGLVPGKHKVVIRSASDRGGKLPVPKEYLSEVTTPLVVDTANLPLEIKVKKP